MKNLVYTTELTNLSISYIAEQRRWAEKISRVLR